MANWIVYGVFAIIALLIVGGVLVLSAGMSGPAPTPTPAPTQAPTQAPTPAFTPTAGPVTECQMSMCDCRCYPAGQTPEALDGRLCGINCLGEFGASGCRLDNGQCMVVYTNATPTPIGGGLANPASEYCVRLEYSMDGENCAFGDGTTCEQWAFFRGKCGQAFSYCNQQNGTIQNRVEEMGGWTADYGVCVFADGSECSEQEFVDGRCAPGQCSEWKQAEGGCKTA